MLFYYACSLLHHPVSRCLKGMPFPHDNSSCYTNYFCGLEETACYLIILTMKTRKSEKIAGMNIVLRNLLSDIRLDTKDLHKSTNYKESTEKAWRVQRGLQMKMWAALTIIIDQESQISPTD